MSDTPLHSEFKSIAALRQALASRQVSAYDITQSALTAIHSQADLNAFLHIDPELSLEQARQADTRLDQQSDLPLLGIPIAHKDLIVTTGWRTTAGSKMLADYVSPFNATVVRQLGEAGAV